MKKLLAIMIVAVFLVSLVPMNITSASTTGKIKGIKHPPAGSFPIGLGDDIPGIDGSSFMEAATADEIVPMLTPQSPWTVAVSDDYLGGFYPLDFQSVLNGTHCNIWIGLDTTVWTDGYQDEWAINGAGFADDVFYFAYPWSYLGGAFWGAPRLLPGYRDYIYGAQLEQLRDAFDNNIWQKCKDFYGDYADRPGPFDDYKIQILIFNIRDGLFWDPVNAPWFIEGYFWSYISNLYNANIIHIDSYQWFRRQGPTPPGGEVAKFVSPPYPPASCNPYEYEGTFAHEYQHLIHRDLDYDELSWVNEGCSGLAQYICGYGFPKSHIANYIYDYRRTSLVIWQGNLANYGATFLWTFYMYEHYGAQFIHDIANNPGNGIAGYNDVLSAYGLKNFDAIFEDWAIANYLDDTSFAKGIYGYYALDIPSANTQGWSIPYVIHYGGAQGGGQYTPGPIWPSYPYGVRLGMALPYLVRYWEFRDGAPELKAFVDGADITGITPHSGASDWYSEGANWAWFRLGQTFAVPETGATLKFWTSYGIEEDWDYGYVEVHDLTTDEWCTLAGTNTIITIPNAQDNPNCPAGLEPTDYLAAGRWNAFTGDSGGWYQELMDLTPFAGHDIELHFTYWTDGSTLGYGFAVDDIEIPEIGFFDNVESGANGWTFNAGWKIMGGVENDFRVNFIETTNFIKGASTRTMYHISPIGINDVSETGQELLKVVDTPTIKTGPAVFVGASQPGYEHSFSTTLDLYVGSPRDLSGPYY